MTDQWKEFKQIATEVKEPIRFFKLERGVANVPATQFLISSLYRSIGLITLSEDSASINAEVLFAGMDFSKKLPLIFNNEQFKKIIKGSLNFPKGNTKNEKQYLISPLIPEIAAFGGTMRRQSSWNAGKFILQIISNCCNDDEEFKEIIIELYEALKVDINKGSDAWSLLLVNEFKTINENLTGHISCNQNNIDLISLIKEYRSAEVKLVLKDSNFSKNVIKDLKILIEIEKESNISRQQWVSLLETFFRLLIFNHIINTLNLSRSYFSILTEILENDPNKIMDERMFEKFINLDFNQKSNIDKNLKVSTRSAFIDNNIHLYCLYNHFTYEILQSNNVNIQLNDSRNQFISKTNILLQNFSNAEDLKLKFSEYKRLNEDILKFISVKDRSLAQIQECLIYIGNKKVKEKELKSYVPDVNFLFAQRKGIKGNPYMFELGSGTISLLTGLIFRKRSAQNFISGMEYIKEMLNYNIDLNIQDISSGEINLTMQSLGIVIDSPDTEGGVLIVKPGWV
jgi:hypothetical protein